MSKQYFQFSAPAITDQQQVQVEFVEGDTKKVKLKDVVFFSTAHNRNNAFFQVSDLMKWQSKPEAILHNFDHDLSYTGGRYLGNMNKITKLDHRIVDGVYEVYGDFESTDPNFISEVDRVTQPSIEISADDNDIMPLENGGFYLKNIDWEGVGWLRGQLAGSGQTRIGAVKKFDKKFDKKFTNSPDIDIMDKKQVQEFLATEEGKELLTELNYSLAEESSEDELAVKEDLTNFILAEFSKLKEELKAELVEATKQPETTDLTFNVNDVVTADNKIGFISEIKEGKYSVNFVKEVEGEQLRTDEVQTFQVNELQKCETVEFAKIETEEQKNNRIKFEADQAKADKLAQTKAKEAEFTKVENGETTPEPKAQNVDISKYIR